MQNSRQPNRGGQDPQKKRTPQSSGKQQNQQRNGIGTVRSSAYPNPMRPKTVHPHQNSNRRRIKRRNSAVSGFAICLVVMIFVSLSLLIVRSVDWEQIFSDKTRQPFSNPDNIVYGPYLTEAERESYLTQYVAVSAQDVYRGSCILVNFDVPYHFPEDESVFSVYKNKTISYKVRSGSEYLQMEAIQALNNMMDAFYEATDNRNIMVNSAYRTAKGQQEVYDSKEAQYGTEYTEAYVQKPGYSEHHTGYAVDFAVYDEGDPDVEGDEAMWTFDGKNEYFWIDQNCSQYGYVLRYSASKEDVTGIAYESWHYRYVGIGNALAMQNMGLSLEEYINFIRDYSYDGTRYYITAANGDIYCLYYAASDGTDGQKIPIPKIAKTYSISGNNIDGYIITALVGNENR